MGTVGDAYDNAMAESFFASLETELIDRSVWRTHGEARSAVFDYIEIFYNRARLHSALGYSHPTSSKGGTVSARRPLPNRDRPRNRGKSMTLNRSVLWAGPGVWGVDVVPPGRRAEAVVVLDRLIDRQSKDAIAKPADGCRQL